MARYPPPKYQLDVFDSANFLEAKESDNYITQAQLTAQLAGYQTIPLPYPNLNNIINFNWGTFAPGGAGAGIVSQFAIGEVGTFLLCGQVNVSSADVGMYAYMAEYNPTSGTYTNYGKTIGGQGALNSYISFSGVFQSTDANYSYIFFGYNSTGATTIIASSVRAIKLSNNIFPI